MAETKDKSLLLDNLDYLQLTCLNEADNHNLRSILASKQKNTTSNYLLSDVDEELLLNIPFHQACRIRAIVLQTSNISQAPNLIKVFINRASLGFDEARDASEPDAAQVIELTEDQVAEGKPITLRFVRFQSVSSLQIFVASNFGGEDETRIDAIDIFGVPVSGVPAATVEVV